MRMRHHRLGVLLRGACPIKEIFSSTGPVSAVPRIGRVSADLLADFRQQPAHHLFRLAKVAAAKQVEMVQYVIEIVERFTGFVLRVQRIGLTVGRIKSTGEPAK